MWFGVITRWAVTDRRVIRKLWERGKHRKSENIRNKWKTEEEGRRERQTAEIREQINES